MDLRNLRLFPRRDGLINEEFDVWKRNEENDQTDPENDQTDPENDQTDPAKDQTNPAKDQTDPATELRLDLCYSNQYEEQILYNDIGVGANAGSMVDMAFVTNDPLSELVWSPQKGLSLKCADFSFGDRKPSILRGAGPSNQTFTHKLSVTGEKSKQVQHRISTPSSKNDCDNKDISSGLDEGNIGALIIRPRHIIEKGIGNDAKEMNKADGVSSPCFKQEEEDLHDCVGKEIAAPMCVQMVEAADMIENKSLSLAGCVDERKVEVESVVKEELELDIEGLEKPAKLTREDSREGLGKLTMCIDYALASDIHVQGGCQASASLPQNQNLSSSRTLEKRESTAENELLTINVEALESLRHQPVEKLKYVGECVEADRSPSYSKIHKKRKKDKEKALSDGYVVGRNSNNNDDNYECVEICAETSSNGKKRGNEQQLAVGSKRVKNQIHGADGSTSFKGQDSSFMNWIANMIKASPNSILEKESSLALTHAHSDNELDGSNKELVVWKKSRDKQKHSTDFPSIFQSLQVGPSTKGRHRLTHDAYYKKEERYKDSVYQAYDANATPLAFHRENNISCCQNLVTKEKLNKSTSGNENLNEYVTGNGADALRWPNMLCFDHSGCHENQMTVSGRKKVTCDPLITIGKDINGTSSSSSIAKRRRNNAENIVSDVQTGVKTSPGSGNGEDHLKSLWITRLSMKTSCSAVDLDSEDQTSDEPNSTGKREIPSCTVDCGCSTCFDRTGGHDDQSSLDKFTPMLLSTRFRSSEAMTSVLARRFDALKHILSNVRETSTDERITCFFCGSRDHHLQNCSKIAASEVEHLSKISSFFGMSAADSCLCIGCFQLNHWAVSCPLAVSRTQYYPESGCSFVKHFRNMEKQPSSSWLNPKFLIGDSSKPQPATCTIIHINDPQFDTDHKVGSKSYHNETCKQLQYLEDPEENLKSSSCMEKKEGQRIPYNSFVDKLPSDGRVVFDMMKKLQLSRTDYLRWMNSNMSLSKLEGLSLRLRLGKWEKGFRGTGYHVAFITGSQNARNSISVKVGGVECLAKSHCISNQVFLEEELRGWWEATSRDRSRVVVEADLEARMEKKRLLGL